MRQLWTLTDAQVYVNFNDALTHVKSQHMPKHMKASIDTPVLRWFCKPFYTYAYFHVKWSLPGTASLSRSPDGGGGGELFKRVPQQNKNLRIGFFFFFLFSAPSTSARSYHWLKASSLSDQGCSAPLHRNRGRSGWSTWTATWRGMGTGMGGGRGLPPGEGRGLGWVGDVDCHLQRDGDRDGWGMWTSTWIGTWIGMGGGHGLAPG